MDKEKGILSSLGEFLSSVHLAISLLIILAISSIFGTLIPQNASPEEYLRFYSFSTYKILKILGLLDMYHSGWFLFLLGLLALNLLVCSKRRFRALRSFFSQPQICLDGNQWKSHPLKRKFLSPGHPAEVLRRQQDILTRLFARPKVSQTGNMHCLFAEKGKFSRLGFYGIHFSILIILAGAFLGSVFGFRGFVNVLEGETVDRASLRSNRQPQPLGFQVRLEKFEVFFYPSGTPKEYKSTVSILEDNRQVLTDSIRVNHPLTYKGISLYQSSYGIADVKKVVLDVREQSLERRFTFSAKMGERVEIPESSSTFTLTRFIPDFQGVGPAFQGVLSRTGRPADHLMILQNYPGFSQAQSGDFSFRVKEFEPIYYSGLQVNRDPGVWMVWAGCILMMVGFTMTFFLSHRRIWVRMIEEGEDTVVEMAGSSHRNRIEFEKEMEGIEKAFKEFSEMGKKENENKETL
jgi:cytochrome c biogenesis protein